MLKDLHDNLILQIRVHLGYHRFFTQHRQMAGALGQQSRRGKRLLTGYNNRALTHFEEHDDNPDAHGFVNQIIVKVFQH